MIMQMVSVMQVYYHRQVRQPQNYSNSFLHVPSLQMRNKGVGHWQLLFGKAGCSLLGARPALIKEHSLQQ